MIYEHKLPIHLWSEDDRPREKLLTKGKSSLSDAELIAILLGTGSGGESALELSQRLLRDAVSNDLNELARISPVALQKLRGIGMAKAVTVVAAMELGRRRRDALKTEKPKVTCSRDAYEIARTFLTDLPHEEFYVLHFNQANHYKSKTLISAGGISGTVADTRIIFKCAIEQLSTGIIICHNHPSGNLAPSTQDIALTKRLAEAGKILEIPVLDHLIVTEQGYYSFADQGLI